MSSFKYASIASSSVTRPEVLTLNNQVAEITLTTQQAYLAKSSVTVTGGTDSTTTTELTPGVVTSGFTL